MKIREHGVHANVGNFASPHEILYENTHLAVRIFNEESAAIQLQHMSVVPMLPVRQRSAVCHMSRCNHQLRGHPEHVSTRKIHHNAGNSSQARTRPASKMSHRHVASEYAWMRDFPICSGSDRPAMRPKIGPPNSHRPIKATCHASSTTHFQRQHVVFWQISRCTDTPPHICVVQQTHRHCHAACVWCVLYCKNMCCFEDGRIATWMGHPHICYYRNSV